MLLKLERDWDISEALYSDVLPPYAAFALPSGDCVVTVDNRSLYRVSSEIPPESIKLSIFDTSDPSDDVLLTLSYVDHAVHHSLRTGMELCQTSYRGNTMAPWNDDNPPIFIDTHVINGRICITLAEISPTGGSFATTVSHSLTDITRSAAPCDTAFYTTAAAAPPQLRWRHPDSGVAVVVAGAGAGAGAGVQVAGGRAGQRVGWLAGEWQVVRQGAQAVISGVAGTFITSNVGELLDYSDPCPHPSSSPSSPAPTHPPSTVVVALPTIGATLTATVSPVTVTLASPYGLLEPIYPAPGLTVAPAPAPATAAAVLADGTGFIATSAQGCLLLKPLDGPSELLPLGWTPSAVSVAAELPAATPATSGGGAGAAHRSFSDMATTSQSALASAGSSNCGIDDLPPSPPAFWVACCAPDRAAWLLPQSDVVTVVPPFPLAAIMCRPEHGLVIGFDDAALSLAPALSAAASSGRVVLWSPSDGAVVATLVGEVAADTLRTTAAELAAGVGVGGVGAAVWGGQGGVHVLDTNRVVGGWGPALAGSAELFWREVETVRVETAETEAENEVIDSVFAEDCDMRMSDFDVESPLAPPSPVQSPPPPPLATADAADFMTGTVRHDSGNKALLPGYSAFEALLPLLDFPPDAPAAGANIDALLAAGTPPATAAAAAAAAAATTAAATRSLRTQMLRSPLAAASTTSEVEVGRPVVLVPMGLTLPTPALPGVALDPRGVIANIVRAGVVRAELPSPATAALAEAVAARAVPLQVAQRQEGVPEGLVTVLTAGTATRVVSAESRQVIADIIQTFATSPTPTPTNTPDSIGHALPELLPVAVDFMASVIVPMQAVGAALATVAGAALPAATRARLASAPPPACFTAALTPTPITPDNFMHILASAHASSTSGELCTAVIRGLAAAAPALPPAAATAAATAARTIIPFTAARDVSGAAEAVSLLLAALPTPSVALARALVKSDDVCRGFAQRVLSNLVRTAPALVDLGLLVPAVLSSTALDTARGLDGCRRMLRSMALLPTFAVLDRPYPLILHCVGRPGYITFVDTEGFTRGVSVQQLDPFILSFKPLGRSDVPADVGFEGGRCWVRGQGVRWECAAPEMTGKLKIRLKLIEEPVVKKVDVL